MKLKRILNIALASAMLVCMCPQSVEANTEGSELMEKVQSIAQECRDEGLENEWEIALWLHDWIVNNADYDYTYTYYYASGVLLKGTGVCSSYSDAYQLLLNEFSIENKLISSPEMNHQWNLVKIEGEWFHVDCTWDDPGTGGAEHHRYFGLNDNLMSRDHYWNPSLYPECISHRNAYYVHRHLNVVENIEELEDIFKTMYEMQIETLECYYTGEDSNFSLYDEAIEIFDKSDSLKGYVFGNSSQITVGLYSYASEGEHTHRYKTFVMEPNCIEGGYTLYRCACGVNFKDNHINANGHEWEDWTIITRPTLSTLGERTHTCKTCQEIETQEMKYDSVFAWELNENGVLTISRSAGSGDIEEGMPWESYCDEIIEIVIKDGVNSIGALAFSGYDKLEKVTINESMTYIGNSAFQGCSSLKKIVLPSSLAYLGESAFEGCSSLEEIVLPEGVTQIGDNTFSGCSNLKKVVLPSFLDELGFRAFFECSSLEEIILSEGLTEIVNLTFSRCSSLKNVQFPSTLMELGYAAFDECSSLEEIILPEGLKTIADYTFYVCGNLKKVILPSTLTELGGYAFNGCSSLEEVVLPSGLTYLGRWAFGSCSSLEEITLPEGLTRINDYVFYNCSGLEKVQLPSMLTEIGDYVFSSCSSLKEMILPSTLRGLGDSVFNGCSSLKEITLPEGLTKTGIHVFASCSNLEKVILPKSLTKIDNSTFANCISLKKVVLPLELTELGFSAFAGCSSLENIVLPHSLTKIGDYIFFGCNNLIDVYYEGTKAEWAAIIAGSDNDELANINVHCSDSEYVTNLFADVYAEDWHVKYVQFVYDRGLMSGSDGQFRPNENMTRAMMVTTLYRMSGLPEVIDYTATALFHDVEAGAWYEDAVNWAYNEGITTGYEGMGLFGSEDDVTREQLAVFFYRYAERQGYDLRTHMDISDYVGAAQVSDYAQEAMEWAVGIGLISGVERDIDGEKVFDLDPQGSATRGQLAAILTRFCRYYRV